MTTGTDTEALRRKIEARNRRIAEVLKKRKTDRILDRAASIQVDVRLCQVADQLGVDGWVRKNTGIPTARSIERKVKRMMRDSGMNTQQLLEVLDANRTAIKGR